MKKDGTHTRESNMSGFSSTSLYSGSDGQRYRPRRKQPYKLHRLIALLLILCFAAGTGLVAQFINQPTVLTERQGITAWDTQAAPNYYRVLGTAVVDQELLPGDIIYEGLDELGRTGRVLGCITYDMMEAGRSRDRADISQIHPSGWGSNAVVTIQAVGDRTGKQKSYHGSLFNRSHLLAKSLGGADVKENLITATRCQNVGGTNNEGGMAYTEGLARDWLEQHPDQSVWYSATPLYEKDELLARSVIVDIRSSDGTLNQEVEVFNAAWGFDIDYATGSFVQNW